MNHIKEEELNVPLQVLILIFLYFPTKEICFDLLKELNWLGAF